MGLLLRSLAVLFAYFAVSDGESILPNNENCDPLHYNCQKGDLIDKSIADCCYTGPVTCNAVNDGWWSRTVDSAVGNKCQPDECGGSHRFSCGDPGTNSRCVCDDVVAYSVLGNRCRCQYWPTEPQHPRAPHINYNVPSPKPGNSPEPYPKFGDFPEPVDSEPSQPPRKHLESSPKPSYSEPSPKPSDSEPSPKPGDSEPSPKPSDSEPSPKPGDSDPSPKPGDSDPSPKPGYSEPSPKPGDSDPSPKPGHSEPTEPPTRRKHPESSPKPDISGHSPKPGDSEPSELPRKHLESSPMPRDSEPSRKPGDSPPSPKPVDSELSVKYVEFRSELSDSSSSRNSETVTVGLAVDNHTTEHTTPNYLEQDIFIITGTVIGVALICCIVLVSCIYMGMNTQRYTRLPH